LGHLLAGLACATGSRAIFFGMPGAFLARRYSRAGNAVRRYACGILAIR